MLPPLNREEFDKLLNKVPSWAIPDNPTRFFELLQKDDLKGNDVDALIDAAGIAPQEVCDEHWKRIQHKIGAADLVLWNVVESLRSCRFLHDGLDCLLKLGKLHWITTIRLHRYVPEDDKLVSIECAGHEGDVAMRLRLGNIVKFKNSSPLDKIDSFWALELGTPVVFSVDESTKPPLEPCAAPRGIKTIRLPYGQCDHVLARHRAEMWVDFPLTVAEHVIGKLSCDLGVTELVDEVVESLFEFWRIVQVAIPYLSVLLLKEDQRRSIVVRDSWDELQRIQTVEKLFDYCTTTLPAKLGCRQASIFTTSRDSIGTEKLVLRKTSFEPCQDEENIAHYNLLPIAEQSLTAWVAINGRALRLQNLKNREFFEKQKQAYDSELFWANKYQDSTGHESFLAIPIFAPQSEGQRAGGREVLGVLRLTEKHGGDKGAYFTETDERILCEVARDVIGPKLVSLIDKELSSRLLHEVVGAIVRKACELNRGLSTRNAGRVFQDAFCETMETVFPERRFARLYLLNIVGKDRKRFKHFAIGGRLRENLRDQENRLYDVERSLTGESLKARKDVVFLNDLPRAEKEGVLVNIVPRAKCALAQRLDSGGRSGAIVVESAGYDIQLETEGHILQLLAGHVGKLLANSAKLGLDD